MTGRQAIREAAVRIADRAKRTAIANNPRMNHEVADLIWANTHMAAMEELAAIHELGFDAGEKFAK